MEPSEPIIDLDTGEPIPLGTDIGVDPSAPSGPRQQTTNRASGAPWKIVAAIAGVVAAASLVFSVFGGSDRAVDRALPRLTPVPSPTAAFDADARPDPARPAIEAVTIPIVSQGITRAGETCVVRSLGVDVQAGALVRFTVPDGLSALDCQRFATDPVSARSGGLRLPLDVAILPTELGNLISRQAAEHPPMSTEWYPIDGRRGWMMRFGERQFEALTVNGSRALAVELPDATLVASWGDVGGSPLTPSELDEAFEQLVASLDIEVAEDRFHYYREPGGWCGGEDYVTRVPDGWFANPNCRWLNTSSESPIVLRCNCLPPLFLQRLTIPFDGDFGFTTITTDRVETRPDGTPVRVIEGLRPDPNNMDRPLRAMIVDGGEARIAVVAAPFTEHALPGHTYDDTLAAQEFLLDHLRFHSGPDCGVGQRWVANSTHGHIDLRLSGDETVEVPSGTTLLGTGCTQRESSELEVRLQTNEMLIGWVDAAEVRSPDIAACPTAEGVFLPTMWDEQARGDFDGDGREDIAYTRTFEDGIAFADLPTAAVLFANGGLAEGSFGPGTSHVTTTRRIPGIGRDLLEVRSVQAGRSDLQLLDASRCTFEVAGWAALGDAPDARAGVCEVTTDIGTGLRIWAGSFDPHQGLVGEVDELWTGRNGRLVFAQAPWDDAPPCGPQLSERRMWAPPGAPGTALAGTHPLALQWATSRDGSIGAVDFRPLGEDRYKVDGRHAPSATEQLDLIGVIEVVDQDTLAFEGTITTLVERLNGGDPCVRQAGQRFIRRPGTDVFRLQDRINCDGARTDWIDITLPIPMLG